MAEPRSVLVLPSPCLVVLVGASGSGKTTWADAHFRAEQIVSSDRLHAVVGEGEEDLAASKDAFALLEQIVAVRLGRTLTTVIDTLGMDVERRAGWLSLARRHDVPAVAVVFTATQAECRARNRAAGKIVRDKVLAQQTRTLREQRALIDGEGFDQVLEQQAVRTAPRTVAQAVTLTAEQRARPVGLQFGLQIPVFTWPGGSAEIASRTAAIGTSAEAAGFSSIWVMDHFRQIPMFGGAWLDMLESYTTLAFLAASTERVGLGTLVTSVAYRNLAHLGKIVATLDVLSGGHAVCGLGAGWFDTEAHAYALPFPPVAERYTLLEDALEFLPLLWGKGSPSFEGHVLTVPEAMCYPRPLQEHVPILVGGNGERRTLRLAAQYADTCNIIGDADTVARKVRVLHEHCDAVGRAWEDVEITQLSTTLLAQDANTLGKLIDQLKPRRHSAERYAGSVNAGTIDDQIGQYRALADAGVQTAIVSFPDLGTGDPIEMFADVITAFDNG